MSDKIQFITLSSDNNVINYYDLYTKHIPTMTVLATTGNVYPYILNPMTMWASTIEEKSPTSWESIYHSSNRPLFWSPLPDKTFVFQ